ncbi:AhpC-TSA-domain-containing protein [Dacryopinax primogenitus]|uniref:thioredoxin-dependent peroxiredoxin n=1 Tax=Dacryopinax primogenitus (strain DJM 731) TaxID=1858805 RepID=M5FTR3_DACPD|nr:AhpC-TSA-domain-containing protein [Dacryopinax primogenitus]EJT99503.1 AhpC-TSA-domain-containing protein [Dacryopinax primogenitus]
MNDAEAAKAEVEEEKVEEKVEKKAAEAETAAEAPTEAPEDAAPGKELELGDVLPQVTLKNQEEKEVDVKSLITSDKGVIFFLVPKANTPGCTKQACGFRDSYPSYTDLGYEVYCLSGDSPAAQAKWKTSQKLPYPLLSDPSHTLIKALGASAAGKTKRSHFVFEKGSGKLILKTLGVKPDDSPKQVLAFLESHK